MGASWNADETLVAYVAEVGACFPARRAAGAGLPGGAVSWVPAASCCKLHHGVGSPVRLCMDSQQAVHAASAPQEPAEEQTPQWGSAISASDDADADAAKPATFRGRGEHKVSTPQGWAWCSGC